MADADVDMHSNSTRNSLEIIDDQPHSSKMLSLEEKSIDNGKNLSEYGTPELSLKSNVGQKEVSVKNSKEIEATVEQALKLLFQVKETIKSLPMDYIDLKLKRPTDSSQSSFLSGGDVSNELQQINAENKKLQQDLQNKQKKIIELASKYEEANDELHKKNEECALLQSSIQQSLSTFEESHASSLSAMSASTESHPFQSLPIFPNPARVSDVEVQRRIRDAENKMHASRSNFKQLTDMNAQWGQYNAEKETIVKELEERVKAQQVEIEHLERLSGSGDASSQSLTFSPAQQAFIDNAYQRIRLEADRYRDQQEAIVQDAQRQIADARKKQTDAENQSGQLQMRVLELENEARALNLQQEELQTALLVATRSSSQTSQDQELISSLREATRQYEDDLQRTTDDYRRLVHENAELRERLNRDNSVQRLVTQNPDGSTTVMTTTRPSRGSNFTSRDAEFDYVTPLE